MLPPLLPSLSDDPLPIPPLPLLPPPDEDDDEEPPPEDDLDPLPDGWFDTVTTDWPCSPDDCCGE